MRVGDCSDFVALRWLRAAVQFIFTSDCDAEFNILFHIVPSFVKRIKLYFSFITELEGEPFTRD